MKRNFKKIGMLMMFFFTFLQISAYDFEVDGIGYEIVSFSDLTCKVVKADVKYEGDIVLPSQVDYNSKTLKVVSIGEKAFEYSESLISVNIPNSVIEIERYAFSYCSSLTSVNIPNSVTEIGYYAFYECSSLTSVKIPNSVTIIKDSVFRGCSSLISVEIPNSVTKIGQYAFEGCSSLISVEIPNSVTILGDSSFRGCSSLTSVKIPNSVTIIGYYAFSSCSSMTSVKIPNSVTEIGEYAFSYCRSLKDISLSDNLEAIMLATFNGCSELSSITIPGSVERIEQYFDNDRKPYTQVFGECESLKELSLLYGEEALDVGYLKWDGKPVFLLRNWDSEFCKRLEKVFFDRKFKPYGKSNGIYLPNLKELIIGEHLEEVQIISINECSELECIKSYAITPPSVEKFSNKQYMEVVVKVPSEALDAYKNHDIWKNFWNLESFDTSGIEDVGVSEDLKKEVGRFNLTGQPITMDYKGISIIKFSDGSTKKIYVK